MCQAAWQPACWPCTGGRGPGRQARSAAASTCLAPRWRWAAWRRVCPASRALRGGGSRAVIVGGLVLRGGGALRLTTVSAGSGYLTGLLPGLLVIGAGAGRVLPAAAITAMSDIAEEHAGLASGLMTTAHEIGAALGVAVFSAVAVAVDGGIAAGSPHGFPPAAAMSAGLAPIT